MPACCSPDAGRAPRAGAAGVPAARRAPDRLLPAGTWKTRAMAADARAGGATRTQRRVPQGWTRRGLDMAACAAETRPMVSAVGKAAALLRAFDPGVDVLSTRALAARTGIPRSTVHVLAATLATEGLLETVPGRGWRLGPLLVGLAGQIIERTGLVAAVEGALGGLLRARRPGGPRRAARRRLGRLPAPGGRAGLDGPGDDGQPRRAARAGLAGRLREGGAGAARARGGRRADRAAVP